MLCMRAKRTEMSDMLTGKTMTAFEAALGELPDRIWIE